MTGAAVAPARLPRRLIANRTAAVAIVLFGALFGAAVLPLMLPGIVDEDAPAVVASAAAVAASVFVLRAASSMVAPYRRAWRLIALALAIAAVVQFAMGVDEGAGGQMAFVAMRLLPVAGGLAGLFGLLGLTGRHGSKIRLATVILEASITGLSMLVITWLVFAAASQRGDNPGPYSPLLVALVSSILIALVLLRLTRVPRSWFGPMVTLMTAGLIGLVASLLSGYPSMKLAVPSALYVLAFGSVAVAPLGGTWNSVGTAVEPFMVQRVLPYLAAIAATLALFAGRAVSGTVPEPVRAMAAVIALALAVRQLIAALDERLHSQQLFYEATHDPLTQLPNRSVLTARLDAVLQRDADDGRTHALLLLGLDEFKSVNDGISHDVGDELLQSLAPRLTKAVRPTDLVVRVSGDAFAVLLENHRFASVRAVCRRLLKTVHEPHQLKGYDLRLTCSIGLATAEEGDTSSSLLSKAEAAMYAAKRAGKNGWRAFNADMQAQALEDLNLLQDLEQAVSREELQLVYQPILTLGSGQFFGAEALLRWHRPGQGWVSIGPAMPALEGSRLLTTIDAWVLREASRQVRRWRDQGWHARVGVNVSAAEIGNVAYPRRFARVLQEEGAQPNWITVEVTEGTALAASKSSRQVLQELRAMGVRVSIDDFGTAYSSLRRLREFTFDSLKIDASFVSDSTDRGRKLLQAMVSIGQSVDVTVIAEGIESAEQAEILRGLGCNHGQGYHLCPPVSADALERKFVDVGVDVARPPRVVPLAIVAGS